MKKTFVTITTFSSSDWHDWKEYDDMLMNDKSPLFDTPEQAVDAIYSDIFDYFKDTDFYSEMKTIKKTIEADVEAGKEYTVSYEDFELTIKKTEDGYTFHAISQFSFQKDYTIHTEEESDIKYLPIRQLVCFPKYDPLKQERVTDYFDTWEEAIAVEIPELKNRKGYRFEDHVILAGAKSAWDEDKWYKTSQVYLV